MANEALFAFELGGDGSPPRENVDGSMQCTTPLVEAMCETCETCGLIIYDMYGLCASCHRAPTPPPLHKIDGFHLFSVHFNSQSH